MIEIFHDSVDISSSLISYNRQQEMCSGIGTLDLVIADKDRNFFPWDFIELFEGGRKKGEYYIVSVDDDKDKGTLTISAQDGSKKLSDYFIDDQYEVESGESARSLITMYLDMAGVSYEFTAGDGVTIGKGASFGMSSAFDAITTILQYSGWYMYFNPINVCIVGTLDTNPGSGKLLTDATITYLKIHKNDDMLRNKAVVWGGTEYPDGGMVHVSKQTITPWNYDENDLRTVVISNGMIRDYESAYTMVNRLMQEFPHLTIEKTINIAGTTTFAIGDSINVDSKWWKGSGLITTHAASFSAGDGFQTNIILDQRCPRLFGFWKEYPIPNGEEPDEVFDYVYIGTGGDGVWRKPINGHTWENYSDGLTDLVIKDLFVKDGIAACVGEEGDAFIRRENDGAWTKISYGPLEAYGLFYAEEELKVIACSIGSSTIVLGINYDPWWLETQENLKCSFVIAIDYTTLEVKFSDQVEYVVTEESEDPIDVWNITLHDLEVMGNDVILSTEGYAQGYAYNKTQITPTLGVYYRNFTNHGQEDNTVNTLTIEGKQYIESYTSQFMNTDSHIISDDEDENILYYFERERFSVKNLGITTKQYPWDIPGEWPTAFIGGNFGMLRQKSETEFDLIVIETGSTPNPPYYTHIYHTEYTIGQEIITTTLVKSMDIEARGFTIIGDCFACEGEEESCPDHTTCHSLFVYNLDSKSSTTYTNFITTEIWDSYNAPGYPPAGWEQTYYTHWGQNIEIIPGGDYVTFARIYAVPTEWHQHHMGGSTYFRDVDTWEVRGSYIQIDGSGSISQEVDKTLSTHESTSSDGSWVYLVQMGWVDDDVGNFRGPGGTIYQAQFEVTIDGAPDKYSGIVVSVDETLDPIASYTTPWVTEGAPRFWDDKLLEEVPRNSDEYSVHIGGHPSSRAVESKYFGTKFVKAVGFKISPATEWSRYFMIQSLDLSTCRIFREDLTTPWGTKIYDLGGNVDLVGYSHTLNDDDNDGTIYFVAKRVEDDKKILIGIKVDGSSYSINKEIEFVSSFYDTQIQTIFGEWHAAYTSTSIYLRKGFSIGSPSKILKYTPLSTTNKFIPLLDTGFNSTIEINKNSPIEAYHKPVGGVTSAFIYQNFTATTEDWSTITPTSSVYDLRTCDITESSTFTVEDGSIGNELKWGIIGTKNELKMFPTSLAGESVLVQTFEGNVRNVETTNFNGNPYLFVAVSGVEILGEEDESGGGFFQRGQNEVEFLEQSSGLPSSGITIIRVDDRL